MGGAKAAPPARVVFRREDGGEGVASTGAVPEVSVRPPKAGEGGRRRGSNTGREKTPSLLKDRAYERARSRIFSSGDTGGGRDDSPNSRTSGVSEQGSRCSCSRSTSPVRDPETREAPTPRPRQHKPQKPNVAIVRNRAADLRDPDFTRGATRFAPGVDESEVYVDPTRPARGGRRGRRSGAEGAGPSRREGGGGEARDGRLIQSRGGDETTETEETLEAQHGHDAYGRALHTTNISVANLVAPFVARPVRAGFDDKFSAQMSGLSLGGTRDAFAGAERAAEPRRRELLNLTGEASVVNDRVSEWLGATPLVDHRQRLGLERIGVLDRQELGTAQHGAQISAQPHKPCKQPARTLLVPRTAR